MADLPPQTDARTSAAGETYPQQQNRAFEGQMALRTVAREAAFFLPYLRPGMSVLDAGCGPGSITIGIAEIVSPGEVTGIDIQPAQVEQARSMAAAQGLANVRIQAADIYRLPFPDHSFDAAFANGVLMHLREPVLALSELRRILRPGGVIGVRDPDGGGNVRAPTTPLLDQWFEEAERVRQHNGSTLFIGRHHRRLLLEAGFARAGASASLNCAGTVEETRRQAAFFIAQLHGLARTSLTEGWLDQATVDAMVEDLRAWGERPDAFYAGLWCEAIAWVDG
jgi:SAM-dependent methyltransferase